MIRLVYVEPVCNVCNAKCVWCHLTYKCSEKMKTGMMDVRDYKKFVDLNTGFPMIVRFVLNGETVLHPDFPSFVNYTLDNDIPLGALTTNLAVPDISENTLTAIAKHPRVIINFGGATPETHRLNTGTCLRDVMSNLNRLVKVKQAVNPGLRIIGKMVINKNNINERGLLRDLLSGAVNVFKFASVGFATNGDNEDRLKFARANLLDGNDKKLNIPCKSAYSLHNGVLNVKPKRTKCGAGYFAVRFDGAVQCCCNAWYHDGVIGDAFKTPLLKVMQSPAWSRCQEQVKTLKYVERCKHC